MHAAADGGGRFGVEALAQHRGGARLHWRRRFLHPSQVRLRGPGTAVREEAAAKGSAREAQDDGAASSLGGAPQLGPGVSAEPARGALLQRTSQSDGSALEKSVTSISPVHTRSASLRSTSNLMVKRTSQMYRFFPRTRCTPTSPSNDSSAVHLAELPSSRASESAPIALPRWPFAHSVWSFSSSARRGARPARRTSQSRTAHRAPSQRAARCGVARRRQARARSRAQVPALFQTEPPPLSC